MTEKLLQATLNPNNNFGFRGFFRSPPQYVCHFLAHGIRLSDTLSWDRSDYLIHAILPSSHLRAAAYICCIGTHAYGCQMKSLLYQSDGTK